MICLRDPVERMFSQYLYHKNVLRKEKRGFIDVVEAVSEYTEKSLYANQIKRYVDLFGRKAIFITTLDEIRETPQSVIRKAYEFIGVDVDFVPIGFDKKINAARRNRFKILNVLYMLLRRNLINWGQVGLWISIRNVLYRGFLNKINIVEIKKEKMPSRLHQHLKKNFHKDILKVEQLINKDLSHWM